MSIREATIDGKALKARVAASLDSSRAIKRFDVDVELIEADLNAYLPPQMGGRKNVPARAGRGAASKRAPPSGWSETPFDLSPLRQADGQAKVKIGRVRYGEVEFEKGTATVNLTRGKLTAVLENLIVAGGTAKMSVTVDGTQRVPSIQYRLTVIGVQARPVLKTFADTDRLSGTTNFESAGRAVGDSQKQMVDTLNGQGRFLFKDGAIHGINIASALRQAQNLGFGASGAQRTDFAELSGSFTITDGLLENRDLKMMAPLVRLKGGGRVPMPPRRINYTVEAKLVGSLIGQGGKSGLTGLPIPISVKGSWDDPAIDVDWKRVFTAAALDPTRIVNMPKNLLKFGKSLGVLLPTPGVAPGPGGTGAQGGVLGELLKMIPGLPGGQQEQQPPPSQQQEPAPNPLKSLEKLFGK
jgi:AsmA protein